MARHTNIAVSAPEDEGSYLASVSDLMSGLLFIFIITLMLFALTLLEQEIRTRDREDRLKDATQDRAALLEQIRADLADENIRVEIDVDHGVLRLGEAILFELGQATLGSDGQRTIEKLAAVLSRVLPCYTDGRTSADRTSCGDRGKRGRVDAIFVEGHTDNIPTGPASHFKDNWDLSTARARIVFQALTGAGPQLDLLQNRRAQPIFSVSGYADRRPVAPSTSPEERRRNRRIDLRFVMTPPTDLLPEPARETQTGMGR